MAAPAPQQVAENPDPNAVPVDENGMPLEEAPQDSATASVEAIEDKALVAVQSIQAAANDAVMAIQQAKEAPAPQATEDLQEAQFSEVENLDPNNTLASWLKNI